MSVRLLILKHLRNWSYEELEREVRANLPDREIAISLNRMRCKTSDGETWTMVRVRDLRERLGLPEQTATVPNHETISLMSAAKQLGISIGSAKSLVLSGILPAKQIMLGSPWLVPSAALTTEPVRLGVQRVIARRPAKWEKY
jgi:hypothetical protein